MVSSISGPPLFGAQIALFRGILRPDQTVDAAAVAEVDLFRQILVIDFTGGGIRRTENHQRAAHAVFRGQSEGRQRRGRGRGDCGKSLAPGELRGERHRGILI